MSMEIIIKQAFPDHLGASLDQLYGILLVSTGYDPICYFSVSADKEILNIPRRIYFSTPSDAVVTALNDQDRLIVACWFSRHHDGYVRERFLRLIPQFDQAWVIAYVMTLCGEYIIQILDYVWLNREKFDTRILAQWLHENPAFYMTLKSRIGSYWGCYYRTKYFHDYVGHRLIVFFNEVSTKHHHAFD